MALQNQTIGPYSLVRFLGRGSFGEVWLADRSASLLTTQVALKLPYGVEADREAIRREMQVWLRASGHPNIVPVIEAEVFDGQVAIASEYIAGGSLEDWLRGHDGRAPTAGAAVEIMRGVLAGLQYLHSNQLIHRDLKPGNVLLQEGIPRLSDFGLTRLLKSSGTTTSCAGTPGYMAPDVFQGAYSIGSDLWAAGAMFYEMLSGTLPYPQTDLYAQLLAVTSGAEPPPLPVSVPGPIRAVVSRMLAPAQDDRYDSAGRVLEAIDSAMMMAAAYSTTSAELPPTTQPNDVPTGNQAVVRSLIATPTASPPIVNAPEPVTASAPSFVQMRHQSEPKRLVILYKRHVPQDEYLVKMLERRLTEFGHSLFVDHHLRIGAEWLKEIEREIRASDAVIVLLSADSISSEMIGYEIEIAEQSRQEQHGKPQILPIRVGYEGPLPEILSHVLDRIEYKMWRGATDDARLIGELDWALANPKEDRNGSVRTEAPHDFGVDMEPVGGPVPLNSKFYVERDTDPQFQSAVARRESIILVKGPRQIGKTSMLARGMHQAREAGARVVITDLQKLNQEDFASLKSFYLAIARLMARQLKLQVSYDAMDRGGAPNTAFEDFLIDEIFGRITVPIIWGLDEVDRLFGCAFGTEVFSLFRSWHNDRQLDPSGHWNHLSQVICYATEAHLFISDLNQSPFNVGLPLSLKDFTVDQAADINQRYGGPLKGQEELERFHSLLGGHPYLVRRGLYTLVSRGMDIAAFEAEATREDGPFDDHLHRILVVMSRTPELQDAIVALLQGRPCPSREAFFRLRTAGVVAGDSAGSARLRCRLYATYLARHMAV